MSESPNGTAANDQRLRPDRPAKRVVSCQVETKYSFVVSYWAKKRTRDAPIERFKEVQKGKQKKNCRTGAAAKKWCQ